MKKGTLLLGLLILTAAGFTPLLADPATPVLTEAVSPPTPSPTASPAPSPYSTPGISVKDPAYGAVGDGVHDDTAAVSMALDYLSAHGGGLYFPPGTYKVADHLALSASHFNIYGVPGQSILMTSDTEQLLRLGDCSSGIFSGLSFQDTMSDDRKFKGGDRNLVYANDKNLTDITFNQCAFSCPNADMDGVYFICNDDAPNRFTGIHFTNCVFDGIGRIAAEVQNLRQSRATTVGISNVSFDQCAFKNCGTHSWGIAISGSAGQYDSGLTITNCVFDGVKFCAIEAMFNQVLIEGNKFLDAESEKTDVIHVTPKEFNLSGFTITNNDASDGTYAGNFIWSCSNLQIAHNNFTTHAKCLFLREDSNCNFDSDVFDTSGGAAVVEDRPCTSITFSNCKLTNVRGGKGDGGLIVCQSAGDSGFIFQNCDLSISQGKAFKLPEHAAVQVINSTLNSQTLMGPD